MAEMIDWGFENSFRTTRKQINETLKIRNLNPVLQSETSNNPKDEKHS